MSFLKFVDTLKDVIGADTNEQSCQKLFMKIDANNDGFVDFQEFINYLLFENEAISKENHRKENELNSPIPKKKVYFWKNFHHTN